MTAAKKHTYSVTHNDGMGGEVTTDEVEGTYAEYDSARAQVKIFDDDDLVGLFGSVTAFKRL